MARFSREKLPDLTAWTVDPIPAGMPVAADELGPVMSSLHIPGNPNRANLVVGILLMVFGPLILPATMLGSPQPEWAAAISYGLCMVALGLLVIWFRKPTLAKRLWVCEGGLIWQEGERIGFCPWDGIAHFTSSEVHGRAIYLLCPEEGVKFFLTPALGPHIPSLAEYIELAASAALIPVALDQIRRGVQVTFGLLTMDREGVWSGRRYCPWSRLAGIYVDATTVRVDEIAGLNGLPMRAWDVSFPMAAQAIGRIIAEDGLPS
jgi:hypothetical protein